MSTFDVRFDTGEKVDKIIFSEDNDRGSCSIRVDEDGDIMFEDAYICSVDLSSFIKALQKAKAEGWGT